MNKFYVYKIINRLNGKFYVGRTGNLKNRFKTHKNLLKSGKHHCRYLQNSWNKYGEENFEFVVIADFDNIDSCILYEKSYISNLNSNMYNMSSNAKDGGDNLTNHPDRELIIEKIGKATRNWYSSMSKEELRELRSRPGNLNGMFGRKHTEESRKKMSETHRKNNSELNRSSYRKNKTFEELFGEEKAKHMKENLSKIASDRTGKRNSFFGKTHSDETKKKLSDSNKGRLPINTRKVIIDGIEYESATKAAKELGVVTATITHRIKSKNKKYSNYFYKDEM